MTGNLKRRATPSENEVLGVFVFLPASLNIMGKVSKQPPKYERMVAWDGQRNVLNATTVRVG